MEGMQRMSKRFNMLADEEESKMIEANNKGCYESAERHDFNARALHRMADMYYRFHSLNNEMKRQEFKLGETFLCGLIKLKCVEGHNACEGCYFEAHCLHEVAGRCGASSRADKTEVIFVKVEE